MWTREFPLDNINIPYLEKETHSYYCGDGYEYIPVSTILSKVKPKFDLENKAMDVAMRRKVDISVIKKEWENKKNEGLSYGTEIHENIEEYFLNGEIKSKRYEAVIKDIHSKVYNKNAYNELICFDKTHLICGTADYVNFDGIFFDIYDFKTNVKFNFENQYSDKFLLKPVSHLPNSEYFIYSLQLSFYANMIEQLTGINCRSLNIYWLKRKIDNKIMFKADWVKYTLPYLKEEVGEIIKCLE
jgi:hypothetical protein